MNRFHVHVAVDNLEQNVRFYSTVFGRQPTVLKDDYAKWMLEDPRINFAISKRSGNFGVNHLGMQVDSDAELKTMRERVAGAGMAALDQKGANCCYAKSDKYWTTDPQGVAWETYHTLGSVPVYGEDSHKGHESAGACCTPASETEKCADTKCGTAQCCS
jgi:catechol 2,3-dioxygenase-like lactoylglutathione lyase family enzyme